QRSSPGISGPGRDLPFRELILMKKTHILVALGLLLSLGCGTEPQASKKSSSSDFRPAEAVSERSVSEDKSAEPDALQGPEEHSLVGAMAKKGPPVQKP